MKTILRKLVNWLVKTFHLDLTHEELLRIANEVENKSPCSDQKYIRVVNLPGQFVGVVREWKLRGHQDNPNNPTTGRTLDILYFSNGECFTLATCVDDDVENDLTLEEKIFIDPDYGWD